MLPINTYWDERKIPRCALPTIREGHFHRNEGHRRHSAENVGSDWDVSLPLGGSGSKQPDEEWSYSVSSSTNRDIDADCVTSTCKNNGDWDHSNVCVSDEISRIDGSSRHRERQRSSPDKKSRRRAPTPAASLRRGKAADCGRSYEPEKSLSKSYLSESMDTMYTIYMEEERDDVSCSSHTRLSTFETRNSVVDTSILSNITDVNSKRATGAALKGILKYSTCADTMSNKTYQETVKSLTRTCPRKEVRFIMDDKDRTYYFISDRLCFPLETWIDSCATMFHFE